MADNMFIMINMCVCSNVCMHVHMHACGGSPPTYPRGTPKSLKMQ